MNEQVTDPADPIDPRLNDLKADFNKNLNCCMDTPSFYMDDAVAIIAWRTDEGSYPGRWRDAPKNGSESSSYAIVLLNNGKYGVYDELEDYTGHGCQCNSDAKVFDDLKTAVKMGLTETYREDFLKNVAPLNAYSFNNE